MDFLVKSDVNMFVIYSEGSINRQTYSLKAWNCKGIIKELTFQEFLDDDKCNYIDEFLQDIKE